MKPHLRKDAAFRYGAALGAAMLGVSPEELVARDAASGVMGSTEAAPFKRELCKMAAAAYTFDGAPRHPVAILYRSLSSNPAWSSGYDRFSDTVCRALAKTAGLLPMASGAAAMHDKLGGGVFKTLTATGALGGASLGSLLFLLSRHAREMSHENQEMLEKARVYKQLRREIEEDMLARDTLDV
jgi:hypothetical protein